MRARSSDKRSQRAVSLRCCSIAAEYRTVLTKPSRCTMRATMFMMLMRGERVEYTASMTDAADVTERLDALLQLLSERAGPAALPPGETFEAFSIQQFQTIS